MASTRKAIIKSQVDGETVQKSFSVSIDSDVTLAMLKTLGQKYVALTTGNGLTVTDRLTTETTTSINDD